MADKNKSQDDLSIEEILGSIRRIIAEDDEPEDAIAAPEVENTAVEAVTMDAPEEEEEPLVLTNKIEPDGTIVDVSEPTEYTAPAPLGAEPPEPEQIDFVEEKPDITLSETSDDITFEENIILLEEPKAMPLHDEEMTPSETLLSSTTAEATSAVMAKLARHTALLEDGNGPTSGPTIEGMVREILKPLVKSWLDENLPSIVQKMVEREIERLTKHL